MNNPQIRFTKDDGTPYPDWGEVKLGEVLDYEQPTPYIVQSESYDNNAKTPVLTANKAFILGHTHETMGIYSNIPVIIFDDFTTDIKYVVFPFKVKSSAIKILKANPVCDLKYIFEVMQTLDFNVGGHKRHWISEYSQLKIPLPCLEEQQKIAEFFSGLDAQIEAEDAALASIEAHKRGMLQGLFPQGGAQPQTRFTRDDSTPYPDWGEVKLGEVCEFKRGPFGGAITKPMFVNQGYKIYEQKNAIYNNFLLGNYYISEEKFISLKSFALKTNDIIMSCSGTMGKFAIVPKNFKAGIINQALLRLRPNSQIYSSFFIVSLLELPLYNGKLVITGGSAIKNVASVAELKNLQIPLPCLEEQQKIAEFFSALDAQIEAQRQKCTQIKNYKKAILQRMFK